ncbi:hypothetical protein D1007_35509 [Hordeum vulgare]|uniref:Uncharacterized protein n=1 Tax=Hordeum vulgare subsp. vulgare TaxID=112509 RepID=A0A8I6XRT4_HORVV|nr:uncharacterized protein LOC123440433 [Hordeum vulgare subsp. vulgare]KAE8790177.1 hypothetical protein D1007_35509 [Hordeum vulgare]
MPPSAGEVARPQSPLRAMMPQSPLRIKQGGKFYERLLTKESSAANPSFRYYGAEPGSVPFVWESEPGTPRDASRMVGGALPAITPPPSYQLRHHGGGVNVSRRPKGGTAAKGRKKRYRFKRTIKVGFIADMFRRLSVGKACWWRPGPSPAQVSSSSRWLVASEKPHEQQHGRHDDRVPAAKSGAVVCSGARQLSPCWMLPFRGAGNRNRDGD